jgi:hypothetical protein
MTDSVFNPESFLDQSTTEQGSRRPPVASGLDFLGEIQEPKARVVPGKKDPNASYVFVDIPIKVDLTTHPSEVARVGVDKVILRHSGSLDYTPSGALDWNPGKNRMLTAYREALNLNEPGTTFSPRMLIGRIIRVKVGHRTGQENDPVTGKPEIYDEISGVTKP